jgi:hypothetical protein
VVNNKKLNKLKNKALMETIKEEVKSFDLSENELMELEFI